MSNGETVSSESSDESVAWWQLLNRIIRKILSHAICVLLNLKLNIEPLKLRLLVN